MAEGIVNLIWNFYLSESIINIYIYIHNGIIDTQKSLAHYSISCSHSNLEWRLYRFAPFGSRGG